METAIELPTDSDPVRVLKGEALAVLPRLPAGCADAVITDPPYSSGGAFRGDRTADTVMKYVSGNNKVTGKYAEFTGDSRDQRAYGYWCALWLDQCRRITKPGGVIVVFTDWRQVGTTLDAMQAGGWIYRGLMPWDKTDAARPAKGRFKQQAEFMAWGSNGPMPLDPAAPCHPGAFRYPVDRDKRHIAGKPDGLLRDLVRIAPFGGLVLDPFAGSGTTGRGAVLEGRRALLIENDPGYYDVCRDHCAAAVREACA
jgi:site-specific DNA-methyltransferase (adenine-specific)